MTAQGQRSATLGKENTPLPPSRGDFAKNRFAHFRTPDIRLRQDTNPDHPSILSILIQNLPRAGGRPPAPPPLFSRPENREHPTSASFRSSLTQFRSGADCSRSPCLLILHGSPTDLEAGRAGIRSSRLDCQEYPRPDPQPGSTWRYCPRNRPGEPVPSL